MKIVKILTFVLILCLVQSCNTSTPQDYFGETTLNTNIVSDFLGGMYRNDLKYPVEQKIIIAEDGKTTKAPKSYVEYIQKKCIKDVEDQIKKIKELKPTDDTKQMITLSLDYFNTVLKIYQTDLLDFAKKLDTKIPQEEAEKLFLAIQEKNAPTLDAKKAALFAVALPYAKKNGLNVSVRNF